MALQTQRVGDVHLKPWVLCQPLMDVARPVRGVVVGHQMQLHICGSLSIDLRNKLQPFLMRLVHTAEGKPIEASL